MPGTALQLRREKTLGVVTTLKHGEADQHFLELLDGVLAAAADAGQDLTVFTLAHWAEAPLRIPAICNGRVDGLVLIGPRLGPETAAWLPQDTAFVAVQADAPMPGVVNLAADEEAGACRMVRHLLNLGHRRILHVGGPADVPGAQRRVAGYLRGHAEARVHAPEGHVAHADDASVQAGRRLLREWLSGHAGQPLPHAIFAGSDALAIGCLDTLASLGFSVPADISVVGFDDTAHARANRLATVRQPLHDMGRRAVELLLQRVEARRRGLPDTPATDLTFPTEIVISHSLSRPRATSLLIP